MAYMAAMQDFRVLALRGLGFSVWVLVGGVP